MEYLLGIPTLHIRGIFSICAKKNTFFKTWDIPSRNKFEIIPLKKFSKPYFLKKSAIMMLLVKFAGEAFAINLYKPIAKMR